MMRIVSGRRLAESRDDALNRRIPHSAARRESLKVRWLSLVARIDANTCSGLMDRDGRGVTGYPTPFSPDATRVHPVR
jgi:hypothetical protein